jgi:thioredoxin 1
MHLRKAMVCVWSVVGLIVLLSIGCNQERAEPRAGSESGSAGTDTPRVRGDSESVEVALPGAAGHLPRLVDLGRGTCIPCKMMAPILEEISREYRGRVTVEVVDLREDAGAADGYNIRLIPTQIFFDAQGNEVWRHEGFLPKDAIVARFSAMGVKPLDR